MKKLIKRKSKSPSVELPRHGGPDITDMVNKVSQQLVFLEKKIDTLICRSSERPSEERHFSRPHQRFDNRSRDRTFTQAVCAECNKTCEVPFRPSGDRPVYCSECFSKRKSGDSFSGTRDNRPRERGFDRKRRFGRRSHPVR